MATPRLAGLKGKPFTRKNSARGRAIKVGRGTTAAVKNTRGARGARAVGKYSFATNRRGAALLGGASG